MINNLINLDNSSSIPKYKQVINSINSAIADKRLKRGEKIPSINQICTEFQLSRDTVMLAFNSLKARGIISSVPGKGYYIKSININFKHKVFLLFDEFNEFKEVLYNSFVESLEGKATVDIFFHHFNLHVFETLIKDNLNKYTSYVIMPVSFKGISPILNEITNGKLYILDQANPELGSKYPSVYQNFEKNVYQALNSAKDLLKKYQKLIIVYPGGKEPEGELKGFIKFCKEQNYIYEVINNLRDKDRNLSIGEAYFVIDDKDLVSLIKKIHSCGFNIGKDIGIISYNDTPLKEVVADGITTISTDFKAMGKTLADILLNNKNIQIENPSSLIRRASL